MGRQPSFALVIMHFRQVLWRTPTRGSASPSGLVLYHMPILHCRMADRRLGLSHSFGAAALQSSLVTSVGEKGLLLDIHKVRRRTRSIPLYGTFPCTFCPELAAYSVCLHVKDLKVGIRRVLAQTLILRKCECTGVCIGCRCCSDSRLSAGSAHSSRKMPPSTNMNSYGAAGPAI